MARLVRPQGRRGEILAEILTDFPQRFAEMREAFLHRPSLDRPPLHSQNNSVPTPVAIEQSWLHKGRVVLKFTGVDSISAAETLRGAELLIPAADRMPLDEDAAYIHDLTGCLLIDLARAGQPAVGIVRDVIQQEGTTDLLVVLSPDGEEHWIPFARSYLVRIDLPARRLEMNLPAGLLEVNAPLSEEERRERQTNIENPEDSEKSCQ